VAAPLAHDRATNRSGRVPGFEFRYRLNGDDPTVHSLRTTLPAALHRGDMVNLHDGGIALGVAGDTRLLGATLDATVATGTTMTRVITDGDAVYAVDDAHARSAGDVVALTGATGAQGIGNGAETDLSIVADSTDREETLVRIIEASHHAMAAAASLARVTGGELNAAITRAVVRLHREQTGRGPTRAQAFYRGNVVVVVMYDVMTRAESSLAAGGRPDMVLTVRQAFQDTMRPELIAIVESLTGCVVQAFMSTNHIEPDMAAEVFVLDRPVPGEATERRPT
jgi:uncharacterized protein YbcI